MKKLIHLSDLHCGYPGLEARLRELVRTLIFLKEPASDYLVLFTGDFVENATQFDPYATPRRMIDLLREAGFTVLACPGNHDYGTGTLGHKRHVPKFKQAILGDPRTPFPKLDVIDGCALVGLDSMAEELNWYDRLFAQGELGKEQLDALDAILSSNAFTSAEKRVVYLHHHPFHPEPFRQLKDSAALGEVLRARPVGFIDALLYGHNHEGRASHGKWGIGRCYDGGTATYKPGVPPRGVGYHRVMDLSKDPRTDYDGQFLPPGLRNAVQLGLPTPAGEVADALAAQAAVNPSAAAMEAAAGALPNPSTTFATDGAATAWDL